MVGANFFYVGYIGVRKETLAGGRNFRIGGNGKDNAHVSRRP